MTITITTTTGPAVTILVPAKTYYQCQGTAWMGGGNCSSCGAYMMGTGGTCLAMIEIIATTHKKHAECPCCECPA